MKQIEIKFKAWDKKKKRWVKPEHLQNPNAISVDLTDNGFKFKDVGLIYPQFIGLEDKNGKEIYEGDIVRDELNLVYEVYRTDYFIYPFGDIFNEKKSEIVEEKKCEVIGNIYENKDLLKVE